MASLPGRVAQVCGVALALAGLAVAVNGLVRWLSPAELADPNSWQAATEPRWLLLAGAGLLGMLAGILLYGRGLARAHAAPLTFLSPEDEAKLLEAIRRFETRTSGELRVHLDHRSRGEILDKARAAFERLGLTATRDRNAVLFYVAVQDRKFAVLGDAGIDAKVPGGFWDDVAARVRGRFVEGRFGDGLAEGIELAGAQLAAHFPPRPDDVNELPDALSRDPL